MTTCHQNSSAFDFFFFKLLSASKMLLFQELRCTIIVISWLSFWPDVIMSRAVTEQIVMQSRRLIEFSVSEWLKLTQFVLFTQLFEWKKQLCNGKTYKKYENEPLSSKYLLLCVSKLEVFTQLPPAYHENFWTSKLSYRDFLQQSKPIPRYVLKECLSVWFK